MLIPRNEYPRPQFVRADWVCLNGPWEFEIDNGDSGLERGLLGRPLADTITVPFCPESRLSGVHHTDFMRAVWYRRSIAIPQEWAGKRVLLHFQAADYDTTIWANGQEVARHRGGFTPISCDLSGIASGGDTVEVVVRARDYREGPQPRGKQAWTYAPTGCIYTRTTGIWQTVWMEPTGPIAFKRPRITPDVANGLFRIELPLTGNRAGTSVRATLRDGDGTIVTASCRADLDLAPRLDLPIPASRQRLWTLEDPFLYDVELELIDDAGTVIDKAASYAGLRSVALDGQTVKINGKVVFQRLVLDQGYYPEGVMTAPSDADLIRDIKLSQAAGFNGARLHQKVFEERFLYHADRMGYIVWGEFADWGAGGDGPSSDHIHPGTTFVAQWLEAVERDYSHPSIVGWCPLNETHQLLHDRITMLDDATHALFLATKAMDTTRPVLDTSGYSHRVRGADIYDSHDYITEADFSVGIANFRLRHSRMAEGQPFLNDTEGKRAISVPYAGQPYFVSEFGGFRWTKTLQEEGSAPSSNDASWGYGSDPTSLEDFYARFQAVCDTLLDNEHMFGYCYTQLTDIQPEENGILMFDRREKFDMARLKAIQTRPAAIELAHADKV